MKKGRVSIVIGILAAGAFLPPLVVPIFVPWSGINCRHQDINIKTGRARYTRSLWFIKVSERTEDTRLSLALQGETVDVADIKAWHRVNTFSPGVRHSPHYIFHSALSQAHQMEMIESMIKLTPERKRDIAWAILTTWQQSGRDSSADEYIQSLIAEGVTNEPGAGDGK